MTFTEAVTGDLNRDGIDEIVVGDSKGFLHALSVRSVTADGITKLCEARSSRGEDSPENDNDIFSELPGWPIEVGALADDALALADFDGDGRLDLVALRAVLERAWEGDEELRLYLRNRVPKYGNGVSAVDELARDVCAAYTDTVKSYLTPNGNPYHPGIYSFYQPVISMGQGTGATPDGRKAGDGDVGDGDAGGSVDLTREVGGGEGGSVDADSRVSVVNHSSRANRAVAKGPGKGDVGAGGSGGGEGGRAA